MALTIHDADTELKRDHYGRPLIIPLGPDGKPDLKAKLVPTTRVTTAAGGIDDKENLIGWKARFTLKGASQRPDIIAAAATLDPDVDKGEFRALVEDAANAAGADAAARKGTALHAATATYDTEGVIRRDLPDILRIPLMEYARRTEGFYHGLIERLIVVDGADGPVVAGTPDRVTWAPALCEAMGIDPQWLVFDLKTGKSMDFGHEKMAAQLAFYAIGKRYNPATGERTPLISNPQTGAEVPVSARWGVIIHLPFTTGEVTFHKVDLASGMEVAIAAVQARALRKRRLLTPISY